MLAMYSMFKTINYYYYTTVTFIWLDMRQDWDFLKVGNVGNVGNKVVLRPMKE